MQALLPFQTFTQLSCGFNVPPRKQPQDVRAKYSHDGHPSVTVKRMPRRTLLLLTGFGPISSCIHPVCAAPMLEMNEPEVIRTFKLSDGVRIQEIIEGEGPEAQDGDIVQVNYVYRRSNGYFVHSTVDQFSGESSPVTLPLDENQIIKGLKDVLSGMRVGGKRRALIPPSVGYTNESLKPIPDENEAFSKAFSVFPIKSTRDLLHFVVVDCSLVLGVASYLTQKNL